MGDTYLVAGLVRKRAELAGEVERTHARLRSLVDDLDKLDGTLRMLAPEMVIEAIRPKAFRPPKDWANRGQMTRVVLSILRMAAEPLTTRDIALQMLVERALDAEDQRMLRLMSKRVGVALRRQRETGVVRSAQGPGQYTLWEVAR